MRKSLFYFFLSYYLLSGIAYGAYQLEKVAYQLEKGAYQPEKVAQQQGKITIEKSAGIWKTETDYGYYRARVYQKLDPIGKKDKIEITEYSYQKKRTTPTASYILPPPAIDGLIGDIRFKMIDGERMLLYVDIEANEREVARIREVFLLSPNGKYQLLEKAQEMDLLLFK